MVSFQSRFGKEGVWRKVAEACEMSCMAVEVQYSF